MDYLSEGHKCLTCEYWGGNARVNPYEGNFESFTQATGRCFCKGVNNPHYYNEDHLTAKDGCGFWEIHSVLEEARRKAEEARHKAEEARREAEEARRKAKEDRRRAEVHTNEGAACIAKGEYDRAIDECTQAINLSTNYAYAYTIRGDAYYNKKNYDHAITNYNQALTLEPNNAIVYNNHGNACFEKGDYDRAIADYEKALKIEPNNEYAKECLERAKKQAVSNYIKSGDASAAIDNYVQAAANYKEALKLDPNNEDVKKRLASAQKSIVAGCVKSGDASAAIGNYVQATANYKEALKLDPNNEEAMRGIERAAVEKAREEARQEALRKATEREAAKKAKAKRIRKGMITSTVIAVSIGVIGMITNVIPQPRFVGELLSSLGFSSAGSPVTGTAYTEGGQTAETPELETPQPIRTRVTTDTGKLLHLGGGKYEPLRLRRDPSFSADVIGNLHRGTDVEILEEGEHITVRDDSTGGNISGRWVRIRSDDNKGWCFSGYLDPY
jgi:tetratricopeptide (TPR) repeat protein